MYHDHNAKMEGWAVFECDDGLRRIQRLDSPSDYDASLSRDPIFANDMAALKHVQDCAKNGSELHRAALNLHRSRYWDRRRKASA